MFLKLILHFLVGMKIRFVIFSVLASLLLPLKAWSAGQAIQFSIYLTESFAYMEKKISSGRYIVTVENVVGACQLELIEIPDKNKSKPILINGLCGIDNQYNTTKPIIKTLSIAASDSRLVYFETPYEQPGRTFYVIARLRRL